LWILPHDSTPPRRVPNSHPRLNSSGIFTADYTLAEWQRGDQLLLLCFSTSADSPEPTPFEAGIIQCAMEYRDLPLQKKIDAIVRKMRLFFPIHLPSAFRLLAFQKDLE
jgi:hypothetical protein